MLASVRPISRNTYLNPFDFLFAHQLIHVSPSNSWEGLSASRSRAPSTARRRDAAPTGCSSASLRPASPRDHESRRHRLRAICDPTVVRSDCRRRLRHERLRRGALLPRHDKCHSNSVVAKKSDANLVCRRWARQARRLRYSGLFGPRAIPPRTPRPPVLSLRHSATSAVRMNTRPQNLPANPYLLASSRLRLCEKHVL
jgi:hypothetical protein